MNLLTWLVEQLASCFIDESFNSWRNRIDNRKRLKLAEETIGSDKSIFICLIGELLKEQLSIYVP